MLRQGISAQALAKVVRHDNECGLVALGLTLYLKSIYFVQYRIPHNGLSLIHIFLCGKSVKSIESSQKPNFNDGF